MTSETKNKIIYCSKNPWTYLLISYLAGAYFFAGWWGQIIVQIIFAGIMFWGVINFCDWLIFDPLIRKIAEREEKKEKERLHELTPRYK